MERYRDEIQKNIPEIDAVLGTGELAGILAAAGIAPIEPESTPFNILTGRSRSSTTRTAHPSASQQLKGGQHEPAHSRPEGDAREKAGRFARDGWDGARAELPSYLYDENTPRLLATPRHSAYIKIAEGCDHPCAFCIIPQLRGKFRSRTIASVVAEAERLAAQGVREINLIGQDTTCFGEDLGIQDGLATLLEQLAQVEPLRWVRFLYAYPNKITPRLMEVLARHPRLCRYIDVPLQHASTEVLKRMKRGGSAEIFLKLIAKLRQEIPDLTLRTSFIVGFPGETEDDFQQLCDFVSAAQFDWLGVFAYSDEEGSPAFLLDGKVPSQGDRAPPPQAHAAAEAHQPPAPQAVDRPRDRSHARRPQRGDRPALGSAHPGPRPGDRRQGVHQRFRRAHRSPARQLLSRYRGRGPRLRPGRAIVVDLICANDGCPTFRRAVFARLRWESKLFPLP